VPKHHIGHTGAGSVGRSIGVGLVGTDDNVSDAVSIEVSCPADGVSGEVAGGNAVHLEATGGREGAQKHIGNQHCTRGRQAETDEQEDLQMLRPNCWCALIAELAT